MNKSLPLFTALIVATAFFTGCSSFEKGSPQTVQVRSFPAGADLYVNGDKVGQTPYDMELGKKTTSTIRVEKDGYTPKSFSVAPKENENSKDYIKFGLLAEVGYYQELTPSPIEVQLEPADLPRSRSADQYSEMVELIAVVDQEREDGKIGPIEHKYKIEKIIEFYSN